MVLLRYITCLVAAFAVISYTVHLERNTPVVLKVKTLLGLDTTNLEIARSAKGGPGFIESALSIVETVQNLPKAGDLLSDGLERKQSKILPEPLRGWHKEDRPFDAIALLDFEDGFYPGRTKRSDTLKVAQTEEIADDRPVLSGALYFRESMRLLITMSDPNRIESVVAKKAADSASKDVLTWRGEHFVVTRDRKSGLAKAGVRIDSDKAIGFMGNVPTAIMQEYLDVVSEALPGRKTPIVREEPVVAEKPDVPEEKIVPEKEAEPETQVATNSLVPAPLSGWTGSTGPLSFEDVLEFDASFTPDGKKREFVSEERMNIDDAFDQGMRIEGGVYESGDKRLMVTVTQLPLGDDGIGGMVMGAGIMESTRNFDRDTYGATIQRDADIMVISRSDEVGYADVGIIIGGAYLFQMRGNATDEDLETYALALNWDEIRTKAGKLAPDWPGN